MTPGPWECWKTWKSGLKPHLPTVRGQQDPRHTSSRPRAGSQSPGSAVSHTGALIELLFGASVGSAVTELTQHCLHLWGLGRSP